MYKIPKTYHSMVKTFLLSILSALAVSPVFADDGETVTIGGKTVGKSATVITFSGDDLTLTYTDGTRQTAALNQVNIAFNHVAQLRDDTGYDNLQVIKTYGGKSVGVTVSRPLRASQWALLCLPFDMSASDLTQVFGTETQVAQLSKISEDTAHFTTCTEMNAGVPYIIRPAADISSFALDNVVLRNMAEGSIVSGEGYDLRGTILHAAPEGTADYIADGNQLKSLSDDGGIRPLNGYFTATTTAAAHLTAFTVDGALVGTMRMLLGDVNDDNKVDINDIMMTVNSTLGQSPAGFIASAADLTGDGNITVSDVMVIVNIFLGAINSGDSATGNGSDAAANPAIIWDINNKEVQP